MDYTCGLWPVDLAAVAALLCKNCWSARSSLWTPPACVLSPPSLPFILVSLSWWAFPGRHSLLIQSVNIVENPPRSGTAPGAVDASVSSAPAMSTFTELHFNWNWVGTDAVKMAINQQGLHKYQMHECCAEKSNGVMGRRGPYCLARLDHCGKSLACAVELIWMK